MTEPRDPETTFARPKLTLLLGVFLVWMPAAIISTGLILWIRNLASMDHGDNDFGTLFGLCFGVVILFANSVAGAFGVFFSRLLIRNQGRRDA